MADTAPFDKVMSARSDRRTRYASLVIFLLLAALLGGRPSAADSGDRVEVGRFSAAVPGEGVPAEWEPLSFKKITRQTRYQLVEADGRIVVQALSHASSSGLIRRLRVDLSLHPILQWRWKAVNVLRKGDVGSREGNDCPAQIFITFAYDQQQQGFFDRIKDEAVRLLYGQHLPLDALTYVWANHAPVGQIVTHPYTERIKMVIVESGADKLNRWIEESRDVYADYRKAFNRDPPPVSGVALMTDSDNTQESVTAYYGDIFFYSRQASGVQEIPVTAPQQGSNSR